MTHALRIRIAPLGPGSVQDTGSLILGVDQISVNHVPEEAILTVLRASAVQILGVMRYVALINAGKNTAGIESAITGSVLGAPGSGDWTFTAFNPIPGFSVVFVGASTGTVTPVTGADGLQTRFRVNGGSWTELLTIALTDRQETSSTPWDDTMDAQVRYMLAGLAASDWSATKTITHP